MILTEHVKAILRAVADGKQIEVGLTDKNFRPTSVEDALRAVIGNNEGLLRIAPETRSINGKVFAAPVDGGDWSITSGMLDALSHVSWIAQVDRDKAFGAIIDALEGRTK